MATVLAPDGNPCDFLVVMRRMPDERRLARCVESGEDVGPALTDLAHQLAGLHRRSPAPDEFQHVGRAPFLGRLWNEGLDALGAHDLVAASLRERTRRLAHEYLAGRSPLLERRIQAARLVDGHGDLLADDVFLLADGPRALDCLEFDEQLRIGDGLADAAFLAMELERLGRPDLGRHFLDAYESAAQDRPPRSLEHHYIAYRAQVRCKVACLRHAQAADAGDAAAARVLAALALSNLEQGRVVAVLVGGPPGSGKSTVARGLAAGLAAQLLSTDELRDEMLPRQGSAAGLHEGRYEPAARQLVYDELMRRAEALLLDGGSVVLDGSFGTATRRRDARLMAARAVVPLLELRCEISDDVAVGRMRTRVGSASEATPEVGAALTVEADPWPEATVLDTAGEPDHVVQRALQHALDAWGG